MRLQFLILTICLILALLGCARFTGNYYLENEQYDEGIHTFERMVREDPNDAVANYYVGRFYLAQEKPEKALPFLSRAAELKPEDADNHFWLGVARWAAMDFEAERKSYLRALAVDQNHIPARLYLAHNYLDNGEWKKALKNYDMILMKDRYNPEALYNRGLALQQLRRPADEIEAWKGYLKYYPDGRWALRAVDHLNALGDFSYRNFTIGYRRVTLGAISFKPGSAKLLSEGRPSLRVVGAIMSINKHIDLEIVCYKKGHPDLALARAKAVRDCLLEYSPTILPSRLKARGEGRAEKTRVNGRTYYLEQAVCFVTANR